MMNRFVFNLLSLLVAGLTASVPAYGYEIMNIDLARIENMTVASIYADGDVDFEHRITTDGQVKVIVDFNNAKHALPQKDFYALPSKTIKSIRTSQFSLDPLITRVVFDIGKPITYTIKDGGDKLIINFPTPNDPDFPAWAAIAPSIDSAEDSADQPEDTVKKVVRKSGEPAKTVEKAEKKVVRKLPQQKAGNTRPKPNQQPIQRGEVIKTKYKRTRVVYNSKGTRDPFSPLAVAGEGSRAFGEVPVPAVEDLKLVGVLVEENGDNVALLEDAGGNGFMLKSGDKIKNGWLSRVTNDVAYFQVSEFGWTRTVSLKLQEPKSEE
ncbi:MAG: AMIN domain-containing protein [candidate division Zixibacteria bacterium]|nr:AMIN domain-containing protein [candidate division Zixibacteria bacterium]